MDYIWIPYAVEQNFKFLCFNSSVCFFILYFYLTQKNFNNQYFCFLKHFFDFLFFVFSTSYVFSFEYKHKTTFSVFVTFNMCKNAKLQWWRAYYFKFFIIWIRLIQFNKTDKDNTSYKYSLNDKQPKMK